MDLSKILVVSGKPDLYELISHTKNGAIVESLTDKRRLPVFSNERISSLNEISMFTENDDVPLREVFQNIYRNEEGKELTFNIKNATKEELFGYLGTVLPQYDKERIYVSDLKKLYTWYNILLRCGKIDTEPEPDATDTPAEPTPEA